MNASIPEDVRARVDAHLAAVERQLDATGMPRDKRRGIVDDLENQIFEMIGAAGDRVITVAEVNEMLGRLDPPEAYGTGRAGMKIGGKPEFCRQARQGIAWIGLAVVINAFVVLWMLVPVTNTMPDMTASAVHRGPAWQGYSLQMTVLILIVFGAASIGTALGWIAMGRIRNSGGMLYGMGLAIFEALFYPVLAAWAGSFLIWHLIITAYYNGPQVSNRGTAICLIGSICTAIAITVFLGKLLGRSHGNAGGLRSFKA